MISELNLYLDMAKQAGQVRFGFGQSGRGSKRVIFKRVNRVAGQMSRGLSRVASQVKFKVFRPGPFIEP